jgi:hypothetical protein
VTGQGTYNYFYFSVVRWRYEKFLTKSLFESGRSASYINERDDIHKQTLNNVNSFRLCKFHNERGTGRMTLNPLHVICGHLHVGKQHEYLDSKLQHISCIHTIGLTAKQRDWLTKLHGAEFFLRS